MYEHYKEASLPLTYRRPVIDCLVRSLALQRSVRVVGLSGMGKSNLLRFLVSHPELLKNHSAIPTKHIYFLHIDCNKLNPFTVASFFRECLFLLPDGRQAALETDAHLLYKQLELSLLNLDRETLVIMVVDRAEYLYENSSPEFFSQLRNLRDDVRSGRMMFIIGSQRPVGDLYELEKLFSDICWVGPLSEGDHQGFFARHEARLGFNIEEDDQERLWRLTGGHPGLLKNALEWLKRNQLQSIPTDDAGFMQALVHYMPIQNYCRRLWENLTSDEQNTLRNLVKNHHTGERLSFLKHSGLLIDQNDRLELFSPLWQLYLDQEIWPHQKIGPMQVDLDPVTRQVILQWQGRTVETVIHRKLIFDCLNILATDPGSIYSKDELINAIYNDEKAPEVLDDALFQLITTLRKLLDPLVKDLCPNLTSSCVQNVRGVGYRLVVDLPL
ncbi:MAG: winged helix-turn-helix domain-containing protein [Anaerolineae bacterium]|nr:winged helix-turn-helix domain-containing protein [Anaerolineae bacterium]MCB0178335.1 winged helix-turn-helix domain-containing protein [Anaerolineae bacterium]